MMKLVHITDFHLVAPGRTLWGTDPAERADRCLTDIAKWHGDADFCVISGDLADRDYEQVYPWLATRLENFPIRTFLIPGNHDNRDLMKSFLPALPEDSNGFIQHSCETSDGVFLFLDTLKGETSAGQYCEQRQNWLQEQLRDAGEKHVRIFMHHPPFDIGLPYMDRIKLDEAKAFGRIVSDYRNVRHIFFGHVHRALATCWQGIACTALPGTNHQVPLVQKSVSSRYSIEPPMYGVVLIEGDKTIVHFDACLDRRTAEMPMPDG